jgi:tetratricopeptide (TPR) repeat protein
MNAHLLRSWSVAVVITLGPLARAAPPDRAPSAPPSSSAAAPPSAGDNAAAKRLYLSATRHFDLHEYAEALDDFKRAFRLKDDAVFLYNIAQCYRLMNKNEDALSFYRSYLRRQPEASNRAEVEQKIVALEDAVAAEHRARATTAPVEVAPRDTAAPPNGPQVVAATTARPSKAKPLYQKWWLWTAVGGVVVVGVAVGLRVGLSSTSGPPTFPRVNF